MVPRKKTGSSHLNGQCMVPGEVVPHIHLSPTKGISIEWQEPFAIYSRGVRTLVPAFFWQTNSIQFWYDNESVNAIINSGHSKATLLMTS